MGLLGSSLGACSAVSGSSSITSAVIVSSSSSCLITGFSILIALGASNSCTSSGTYIPLVAIGQVVLIPSLTTLLRSIWRGNFRNISLPASPATLALSMSQVILTLPPCGCEKVASATSSVSSCHSTDPPDCKKSRSIASLFLAGLPWMMS